jgi:hypothetical protein
VRAELGVRLLIRRGIVVRQRAEHAVLVLRRRRRWARLAVRAVEVELEILPHVELEDAP